MNEKVKITLMVSVALMLEITSIVLLWRWFISPLGVVGIGFPHALGISLFVSVFNPIKKQELKINDLKLMIAKYVIWIIFGFITHLFISN